MKYGVLGTGVVGATIAGRLAEFGHDVMMGSRTATNEKALAWRDATGEHASVGTFADAAAFGDVVFNCTKGSVAEAVISSLARQLDGKILVDVANPLVFVDGAMHLDPGNTDSLAEHIQKAAPGARVVKSLNNLNCSIMVDPARVPGQTLFLSGDDAAAKTEVAAILAEWGWTDADIIDLGDLTTARSAEMILPLWVNLAKVLGRVDFGIQVRI